MSRRSLMLSNPDSNRLYRKYVCRNWIEVCCLPTAFQPEIGVGGGIYYSNDYIAYFGWSPSSANLAFSSMSISFQMRDSIGAIDWCPEPNVNWSFVRMRQSNIITLLSNFTARDCKIKGSRPNTPASSLYQPQYKRYISSLSAITSYHLQAKFGLRVMAKR